MISGKIKYEIENSPVIARVIDLQQSSRNWHTFTRTTFDRIARKINQEVTMKVIEAPFLVTDFLLFGESEYENILYKYRLRDLDGFIEQLKLMNYQKPYGWISGKTLQGYWNNGDAKEKKLNVLLTFIGVNLKDWDEWKSIGNDFAGNPVNDEKSIGNDTYRLLRQHFTGHYYRYYQKSDNSPALIKTPFIIRNETTKSVVIETKTLGHQYKSSSVNIRNGILYVECENIIWNEKESYIFNIGFETNPKVITGVSNTLNRKGQTIAIKNVLVKQDANFNYADIQGKEIPFTQDLPAGSEEASVMAYFKNSHNLIIVPACSTLEELNPLSDNIFA